jgi:hypothetical protein
MIKPLDYLINICFKYKIDMLSLMSMSSCSNAIKHAFLYKDFNLHEDYTPKDNYAPFILTR